jgi:outer membrane biosynthesis protein TonB
VPVSSRVIALVVVGMLVAAGAGFAIGQSSASGDESSGPAGVPEIDVPAGVSDTPQLQTVGAVPNLEEPPQSSSGGATASPDSTPSTSAPSETPSAEPAPPTSQPEPQPEPQPQPQPEPPPPPPGEG